MGSGVWAQRGYHEGATGLSWGAGYIGAAVLTFPS